MKVVFLLFDSLNRHALSCYAPPGTVRPTPNFDRLGKRGVVFDRHFVGSLPCMPARRDIQTGRLNFLHRGWGPLEPFDPSVAELLRLQAGIQMQHVPYKGSAPALTDVIAGRDQLLIDGGNVVQAFVQQGTVAHWPSPEKSARLRFPTCPQPRNRGCPTS